MGPWPPARIDAALLGAPALALIAWTVSSHGLQSALLVAASLGLAAASFFCIQAVHGTAAARIFLGTGAVLGWLAEQAGATLGWFFGHYTYTEVLGPRLGAVPVVIPFMWFGLCAIGHLLACLLLWRAPRAPEGAHNMLLAALLGAMLVTAFDLGADPYFVYVLKAWIMQEKDGDWFGETVRGFEGWMIVSFTILVVFQALARGRMRPAGTAAWPGLATGLPIAIYTSFAVFQMMFTQPLALKVVAFFVMGIPALVASVAWHQGRAAARGGQP